jgi:sporulation protein YabP
LNNRKKLSLSGVEDVTGFNEELISLVTGMGGLYIKGENLHIERLDLDKGEADIDGSITSLQYTRNRDGRGLLKRILS